MFQKKYTSYTYIFRGTGEDFPRIYPRPAGKTPPRGYRERFPREYTRVRPEKAPPRGYRERFPANIPETGRKNAAARVQEKIPRVYTRVRPEKHRRAGTGEDFPRIYPRPAGKTLPRGYRRRFPANIPETSRKNAAARVQGKISREYTRDQPEKHRRAGTGKENARIYLRPAGKIPPRGYRERKRANIPETARKNTAARVQGRIPREYTRGRPEKHRRAGTEKDSARIYPWPAGKTPPRGYRRRFPANIPETGRKNVAARVQERISRGYTRDRPEKCRRAGTGKDFPRIYPRPAGKNTTARVQGRISREYTRDQPEKRRRAGTGKDFPRIYPWPAGKTPPRGYRRRFPADIPVNMRRLAPRELY